jgi:hypothetical protein
MLVASAGRKGKPAIRDKTERFPANWFSAAIAHFVVRAGESDCMKSVREKIS